MKLPLSERRRRRRTGSKTASLQPLSQWDSLEGQKPRGWSWQEESSIMMRNKKENRKISLWETTLRCIATNLVVQRTSFSPVSHTHCIPFPYSMSVRCFLFSTVYCKIFATNNFREFRELNKIANIFNGENLYSNTM